jgi:hypothetical protein|tara:strand:+ start:444 stop:584 length:141 start_codon:yes stop_codon:yes gene_type:complete
VTAYDALADARASYELAIAELRKRLLREGRAELSDDEERRMVEEET